MVVFPINSPALASLPEGMASEGMKNETQKV